MALAVDQHPDASGPAPLPGFLQLLILFLLLLPPLAAPADLGNSESRLGILRGADPGLNIGRAIQLSSSPRVFLFNDFLSEAECQYLILSAKRRLEPPTGKALGSSTILRKYQDGIVRRVEDRISHWLFPPRKSPEAIQMLRYNEGQTFDVHYEFYSNPTGDKRKGTRAATVILFLSDVERGGEVVFPRAALDEATAASQRAANAFPSTCNSEGLMVRPRKGAALYFINLDRNGRPDPLAEFRDCPVLSGERWLAAKWVAVQKYAIRRDPNACTDEHENCEMWARRGECEKNVPYMIGKGGQLGNCRKACKVCTPKK